MIKVIIIDDEYIVRKGLIATINWQKYNMEVVGDAANGQKGWELFQEQAPDVVITDIVMPEVNGIELSRKIKQSSPKTKILLLSCHRDFEYAQEGIRLGASGYILKTAFQDEEFEEYLKRFEEELHRPEEKPLDSALLTKEFYEWLCGFENSFTDMLNKKCQKDWQWIGQPFYIYHLNHLKHGEQQMDELFPGYTAKIICGHDQCFLFIPEDQRKQFEQLLFREKNALKWNCGGPFKGTEDWMTGVQLLYSKFKLQQQYKGGYDQWPEPIQKAVQLISNDLSRPYTSVVVAHEVGLSRSHFSTLFKKSVGASFYVFTEKLKLDMAKELLEATPITLQEIAEKVGIHDGKYFSKWFKKCTGLTPSEYRQTKRRTSPNNFTPSQPVKTEN